MLPFYFFSDGENDLTKPVDSIYSGLSGTREKTKRSEYDTSNSAVGTLSGATTSKEQMNSDSLTSKMGETSLLPSGMTANSKGGGSQTASVVQTKSRTREEWDKESAYSTELKNGSYSGSINGDSKNGLSQTGSNSGNAVDSNLKTSVIGSKSGNSEELYDQFSDDQNKLKMSEKPEVKEISVASEENGDGTYSQASLSRNPSASVMNSLMGGDSNSILGTEMDANRHLPFAQTLRKSVSSGNFSGSASKHKLNASMSTGNLGKLSSKGSMNSIPKQSMTRDPSSIRQRSVESFMTDGASSLNPSQHTSKSSQLQLSRTESSAGSEIFDCAVTDGPIEECPCEEIEGIEKSAESLMTDKASSVSRVQPSNSSSQMPPNSIDMLPNLNGNEVYDCGKPGYTDQKCNCEDPEQSL